MRLQPSHHPDLQQQQYWQRHFDNRLNALGIENIDNAYYSNPPPPDSAPYRYGVYRGKAVPNSNSSGVHLYVKFIPGWFMSRSLLKAVRVRQCVHTSFRQLASSLLKIYSQRER